MTAIGREQRAIARAMSEVDADREARERSATRRRARHKRASHKAARRLDRAIVREAADA